MGPVVRRFLHRRSPGIPPPTFRPVALWALALLLLAGCATLPAPVERSFPQGAEGRQQQACLALFHDLDETVARAGVADAQAVRIPGFPYLRVDRFLASFARDDLDEAGLREWVERMRRLDLEARRAEIANLDEAARASLAASIPLDATRSADLGEATRSCGALLAEADLANPAERAVLKSNARVPPDYALWQRVTGLYPITALPFSSGMRRYEDKTRASFAQDLSALPVRGALVRYAPPSAPVLDAQQVAAVLERSGRNPLGIPDPASDEREALFASFAPVLEVDTVSGDDRVGSIAWLGGDTPQARLQRAVVYRHLSHTRLDGRVLLQLNYVFWFPARPRTGSFDLLGGHLDGITWRVTLGADGWPLLADTMHNCGCYHMFFPAPRLKPRPAPGTLEETALAPQPLPALSPGGRHVLRIESGTHYLQRMYAVEAGAAFSQAYQWAEYDELRSLPRPEGGRRSAFGPDGIVPGTQRAERYLFWPMGVPQPGAMRQWGRHATAFVGERHFDDVDLIGRYFELR